MDVLHAPGHVVLESLLAGVGLEPAPAALGRVELGHGRGQPPAHLRDRGRRRGVGGVHGAVHEHVGQDRGLVAQVVEGHHHVADHQRHVRHVQRVRVRLPHRRLGEAHQVVAEQAHGAAGERRQALQRGGAVALQLQRHDRVGVGEGARLAAHGEHAVVDPDGRARAVAQERPAPEAGALLGRLEQERRPLAAELEVGRHRRLGVGDEGVADRHERVLPGQRACLLERGRQLEVGRLSGDGH